MKPVNVAIAGVLLIVGYRAWVAMQPQDGEKPLSEGGWLSADNVLSDAAQAVDSWTGGMLKISAMSRVDKTLLDNANVQAMLQVIRTGEGTVGPQGYTTLYGGGQFESMADHPRLKVTRWGRTSTAAGAYQALMAVWDETAALMKLPDFGKVSQDLFALGRMAARGALHDVVSGNFSAAIAKLGKEWASLPGSPYGQGTLTMSQAKEVFQMSGGRAIA